MLVINKGVTINEVVTIKLTSGEELVAKLLREDEKSILVSRPQVLANGPQGIGMVPYLFTVDPDRDISLNRATIVVLEPSDDTTSKQYLSSTSGIIL